MLIFENGLRIVFKDHSDQRKTGVISGLSTYVGDDDSRYIVDVYECGKLSDNSYYVLESQILQVWIKDTDGFNVWVRLVDLYASYPNGTIIGPDTIYKYHIDGRNSGRYPWNEYVNYMVNDEKATKAAIREWRIAPKKVIFNGPATIVMWQDGTKTIVKCQEGDTYDKEKGFAIAIIKRLFDDTSYFNTIFKSWVDED